MVAGMGVLGTLLAPLAAAWVGARSRWQEVELRRLADHDARRHEATAADLERRRATYIALNTSARLWRIRLMEDLNRFPDQAGPSTETEEARLAFQNDFAQAQMLVPDTVLDAANRVRIALADAYKQFRHLGDASASDDHTGEELRAFLLHMWDQITQMQAVMRKDLGVGSGAPVPSERPGAYRPPGA
ncbi:hypothetical protein [Streptomyces melanogenes]|uniref:Secreted protein n=1 Tax=Streptomyces melanogenes TaxID=67326 RepID=A0ABZ1XCQ5_9ACTN|nr:hypothetical protein [Streptomyces melanogenes]